MKLTIFAQWFAVLAVVAALGCGGESAQDTLTDAASDVSARASDAANAAADAASDAASSASDAASNLADDASDAMADDAAGSDEAESCLGLVGEAKFAEAIPVCTQALGLDPSNSAVQQALEKAKSEAAGAALGDAGGAAGDAAGAAGDLLGR